MLGILIPYPFSMVSLSARIPASIIRTPFSATPFDEESPRGDSSKRVGAVLELMTLSSRAFIASS